MQAQTIKHEFLKIDGKISGVVISKKEFARLVKIVNEVNLKSKLLKKEHTVEELQKIRKIRNRKTIPVDQFFKKFF